MHGLLRVTALPRRVLLLLRLDGSLDNKERLRLTFQMRLKR